MSGREKTSLRDLRFGVAGAVFGLLAVGALAIMTPAKAEVTVTMAQGIDPEGLDPAYETLVSSRSIFTNIYDTLVWRDAKGKLLPSLAESWQWLDQTTLQLNLRKGVKFHNGDLFTAYDLIWTSNRYMDKEDRQPLYSYVKGLYKTIEKKDDYTVVMHLAKPNAMQFGDFARMPVLPKKAFLAMGKEKFSASPIGTGPFKFKRWDRNEQLVLVAFDDHWRGRPSVDKYVIKPIPEDFGRFAALKTGAVDIIANLPPERVAELEKDPKLKVGRVPSARGIHYAFNMNIKPYSDVRVRQVAGVLGLALEAFPGLGVELDVWAQDLQRDRAPEPGVHGLEDLALGTLSETVGRAIEFKVAESHWEGGGAMSREDYSIAPGRFPSRLEQIASK